MSSTADTVPSAYEWTSVTQAELSPAKVVSKDTVVGAAHQGGQRRECGRFQRHVNRCNRSLRRATAPACDACTYAPAQHKRRFRKGGKPGGPASPIHRAPADRRVSVKTREPRNQRIPAPSCLQLRAGLKGSEYACNRQRADRTMTRVAADPRCAATLSRQPSNRRRRGHSPPPPGSAARAKREQSEGLLRSIGQIRLLAVGAQTGVVRCCRRRSGTHGGRLRSALCTLLPANNTPCGNTPCRRCALATAAGFGVVCKTSTRSEGRCHITVSN